MIEDHGARDEPEDDRQRQSDQEEAGRDGEAAPQHGDLDIRRIGEEHQRQREFGKETKAFALDGELQKSKPLRAEQDPNAVNAIAPPTRLRCMRPATML
jgi:hypothetical protein